MAILIGLQTDKKNGKDLCKKSNCERSATRFENGEDYC